MENEKPRAKHVSLTAQQDAAIRHATEVYFRSTGVRLAFSEIVHAGLEAFCHGQQIPYPKRDKPRRTA